VLFAHYVKKAEKKTVTKKRWKHFQQASDTISKVVQLTDKENCSSKIKLAMIRRDLHCGSANAIQQNSLTLAYQPKH